MNAGFLSLTPLLANGRRASPATCNARPLRMSVHHLRAPTVAWVLPVLPSTSQLVAACGNDRVRLFDLCISAAALVLLGAGVISVLPLFVPFARASVLNSRARTAPHAALLLGTIEHGMFIEGERKALPVAAPPSLHGSPAAALVLAHDPHCERVARVEQVYVPGLDRFLVASSRARSGRFLKLVEHAYQK